MREPLPGRSLQPAAEAWSSASCAAPRCSSSSQRRAPRRSSSRSSLSCLRCSFTTPFSSRSSSKLAVCGSAEAGLRCHAVQSILPVLQAPESPRPSFLILPHDHMAQQALPATSFMASSLALVPGAVKAQGWTVRCLIGTSVWFLRGGSLSPLQLPLSWY